MASSTLTTEEFNALSDQDRHEWRKVNAHKAGIVVPRTIENGHRFALGLDTHSERTRNALLKLPVVTNAVFYGLTKITLGVDPENPYWQSVSFTEGDKQSRDQQIKAVIASNFVKEGVISSPHELDFYFQFDIGGPITRHLQ